MHEMIIKDSTAYWNLTVEEYCTLHELARAYGVSISCRPSKASREHIVVTIQRVGASETAMMIDAATVYAIPFKPNDNIFFYKK